MTSSSSPTQTCRSGGGRPAWWNAARLRDSSTDSDRASLNAVTSRARRRPGHRGHSAMTAASSRFDVSPACRAESATATPWANGSVAG